MLYIFHLGYLGQHSVTVFNYSMHDAREPTNRLTSINPLDSKGNYSATSNNTKLAAPPSPLLAVPNVTAHPSTASVPVTVLLYDGPLLCGFNVAIEGLMATLSYNGQIP